MTPLRHTGRFSARLVTLLFVCVAPLSAAPADEIQDAFDEGMQLLREGNDEDALRAFRRVLALDPGNEAAYELWKETDSQVWLEMLVRGGEIEQIAKRISVLARAGREGKRDDGDAIRALVEKVQGEDAIERRRAILALGANHGAYAVPYMLPALADQVDDDRRVTTLHALTEMPSGVVLPLVEALASPDEFLRRQVAHTLGYIGDPRSRAALSWAATSDPDGGVRAAAAAGLDGMGGVADAANAFLALGDAYRQRHPDVLGPGMRQDVVWSWSGARLAKRAVPAHLYAEELAKKQYFHALEARPGDPRALAGIAAVSVAQLAAIEARTEGGADVGDLGDQARSGLLAVAAAGPAAMDAALAAALESEDFLGGTGLCRAMGGLCTTPSGSLRAALGARSPVDAEAALALARIAQRGGAAPDARAIGVLGEAAAREILRVAAVVDADAARAARLADELRGRGASVSVWGSGATALASMRRAAGFDLFVVAESLPDLTAFQVIDEIRTDYRTSGATVLVAAADADEAEDLFGERADGVVTASDLTALDEATSTELTGERATALRLAAQAAEALAGLAGTGADLGPAVEHLARAVEGRPDDVAAPALTALGRAGDPAHVDVLVAAAGDEEASEEVRAAAAYALGDLFARFPRAGGDALEALQALATEADSFDVRLGAARALGNLELAPEMRTQVLGSVRAPLGEER